MVGRVLALGRLNDARNGPYMRPPQRGGHGLSVLPSLVILIRNDDDLGADVEVLVVLGLPLSGSAWVARSRCPGALERVNVFLALADVDHLLGADRLDQLREPIGDAENILQVPRPPRLARRIGPPLGELLVSGTADLEEQLAAC